MARTPRPGFLARMMQAVRSSGPATSVAPPKFGAMGQTGGYEGAQGKRRLAAFRPSESSINSLNMFSGPTLRARARYLVRNNPYARKAQRVFVTNLIGTGIRPMPQPKDGSIKDEITQLWNDWIEEADADGLVDFYGLQELVANALFESGECFVRRRPRLSRDGLSVPLQIQLLESEFCPYELNTVASNGNVVRCGIEFNAIGQRTAYYFWKSHPGDLTLVAQQTGWTRVPAQDVLHIFKPVRPGQIRGVSWLTTAIVIAYIKDQHEDAELARKLTTSLYAGFIYRASNQADDPPIGPQDAPGVSTASASSGNEEEVVAGLSPGSLQYLNDGEKIEFSAPADSGPNYEAFEYRALLKMCAGMDLPYSSVTGDYKQANFSSERARQLDARAAIRQTQRTFNFQMCKPIYRWFLSDAVLAGALPIRASAFNARPRDFVRSRWIPPMMEWVDPMKDMQASLLAMRAGVESREAVVLSRGQTLEEVDAAAARGNESADSHGLVYDSDPRLTAAPGVPPARSAAPGPEKEEDEPAPKDDDEEDVAA